MARSARELFDLVYPGITDRMQRYLTEKGGGWLPPSHLEYPEIRCAENGDIHRASMALRLELGDRTVIQLACRNKKMGGVWKMTYRSFHCGPDARSMDEVYFRIDEVAPVAGGFHCHIRGHGKDSRKGGHIKIADAEGPQGFPSLVHTDPYRFLDLVDEFLATKRIPLKKKGGR